MQALAQPISSGKHGRSVATALGRYGSVMVSMMGSVMTRRAPDLAQGGVPVVLVVSPQVAILEQDARSPRVLLEQAGLHVAEHLGITDLAGDGRAGKRWRQRGYRAVIAAGGDGTVGTTVSHLAGTGIPLGILPMGTSNNIARALGIPFDPAAAVAAIVDGVPIHVDTGLVVEAHGDSSGSSDIGTTGDTGPNSSHTRWRLVSRWLSPQWMLHWRGRRTRNGLHFLHAAALGLNAEFAHLATDASRRAALGDFTYPASSLAALKHLRPIAVTLQFSGVPARDPATGRRREGSKREWQRSLATEVLQLAVVNTPLFGGALTLRLPGVDAHDHLLDVVLVEPPRLNNNLDTVRAVMERLRAPLGWRRSRRLLPPGAPAHQHQERADPPLADLAGDALFPGIRRYQARAVSIATATPVDVTLDGEVRARTPALIRVAPAALAVLLPHAGTGVLVGGNSSASVAAPTEMPA
jgi:diacylglycerol kinase family enzyme